MSTMRKSVVVLAALCAVFFTAQAYAQGIERLSAEYLRFDGSETSSNVKATGTSTIPGTGGNRVYSKTVFVPYISNSFGNPLLYITISAVGDNHGGESNFLSCNVDGPGGAGSLGTVCNPTPTTTGVDEAPPGWTTLTHHFAYETTYGSNNQTKLSGVDGAGGTTDEHDTKHYYTCYKSLPPG